MSSVIARTRDIFEGVYSGLSLPAIKASVCLNFAGYSPAKSRTLHADRRITRKCNHGAEVEDLASDASDDVDDIKLRGVFVVSEKY